MDIENLFPVPIGLTKYDGKITKSQLKLINGKERAFNIGNENSIDKNVLNENALLPIKKFIEKSITEYFEKIYCPTFTCSLKITQSWLNWTSVGQHHHQHYHTNSFVSGVFYVDAVRDEDRIYFYRPDKPTFETGPRNWNIYNSASWWYPCGSGDLILFPSSLSHSVMPVERKDPRISIAFNTFFVGDVGNPTNLNLLTIKA